MNANAKLILKRSAAAAMITAGLTGAGVFRYGSVRAALAAARGDALVADAATKSFGKASPGQRLTVGFEILNVSSKPVRLVGSTSSCTCTLPDVKFPVSIPAWGRLPLRLAITPSAASIPNFRQSVLLYTDRPDQPDLGLRVIGEVAEPVATSHPHIEK